MCVEYRNGNYAATPTVAPYTVDLLKFQGTDPHLIGRMRAAYPARLDRFETECRAMIDGLAAADTGTTP